MRARSWRKSAEMTNCFHGTGTIAVVWYWRVDLKTRRQFLSLCHLIDGWNVIILSFIATAMQWQTFSFLLAIFGASVFKPNLKVKHVLQYKNHDQSEMRKNTTAIQMKKAPFSSCLDIKSRSVGSRGTYPIPPPASSSFTSYAFDLSHMRKRVPGGSLVLLFPSPARSPLGVS